MQHGYPSLCIRKPHLLVLWKAFVYPLPQNSIRIPRNYCNLKPPTSFGSTGLSLPFSTSPRLPFQQLNMPSDLKQKKKKKQSKQDAPSAAELTGHEIIYSHLHSSNNNSNNDHVAHEQCKKPEGKKATTTVCDAPSPPLSPQSVHRANKIETLHLREGHSTYTTPSSTQRGAWPALRLYIEFENHFWNLIGVKV